MEATLTDALCDRLDAIMAEESRRRLSALETARRRAFNAGSDARLASRPLHDCAYEEHEYAIARYWFDGWRNVSRCWGAGVRGRWRVRPLPAVDTSPA